MTLIEKEDYGSTAIGEGYFTVTISVIGKDNMNISNINELMDSKKILPKNVFWRDFSRQDKENKVLLSKSILNGLLQIEPLSSQDELNSITVCWDDSDLMERFNYTYDFPITTKDDGFIVK